MRLHHRIVLRGLALLLTCSLAVPATADAATRTRKAKVAKAAKSQNKTPRVKFGKDSAETTSERDRRLQRECKGRPNAGACLGYAS